jgi:hypothetical protein
MNLSTAKASQRMKEVGIKKVIVQDAATHFSIHDRINNAYTVCYGIGNSIRVNASSTV